MKSAGPDTFASAQMLGTVKQRSCSSWTALGFLVQLRLHLSYSRPPAQCHAVSGIQACLQGSGCSIASHSSIPHGPFHADLTGCTTGLSLISLGR